MARQPCQNVMRYSDCSPCHGHGCGYDGGDDGDGDDGGDDGGDVGDGGSCHDDCSTCHAERSEASL